MYPSKRKITSIPSKRVNADGNRERLTRRILPSYMRRSRQVTEVLRLVYLRGLSTGEFREALPALLREEAAGLSPTAISWLTAAWDEEYEAFRRRDLSGCDYIYVWVGGNPLQDPARGGPSVHAGGDRGAGGRDEGAGGAGGRLPGERRELGHPMDAGVGRAGGMESW